jgi:hypothetical protein
MRIVDVWLIGSLSVALPLLIVCAVGWWRSTRRARWLETQVLAGPPRDETTERLEQQVRGLALQLDELASSQDFLQRMVTNKLPPRAPATPKPPRARTPV